MLDYLFDYKVWMILGLILVIADVFIGTFYILPIGIAGFVMAGMLYLDFNHDIYLVEFSSWREIVVAFAIISMVAILILRFFFGRSKMNRDDISEY